MKCCSHTVFASGAVAIAAVLASALVAPAQDSADHHAGWIKQLASREFADRQQATTELSQAGLAAIPALVRALDAEEAEVRRRAVRILIDHCHSPRAELKQAARQALADAKLTLNERGATFAEQALARVDEATAGAALTELSRLGATVMPVASSEPRAFNVQIGDTWLGGDERLALLSDLGDVPWLSLENAPIGDAALSHVARLTGSGRGLTKLYLGSSRITGRTLATLAPLKNLQYLSLKHLPIDDIRLATLPDFPQLQYLGLDGTLVGDAGVRELSRFPKLQVLWLDQTRVTDAGLAHLVSLENLRTLYLPGTKVTGPGLAELRHLPNLTSVSLKGTTLAPGGLQPLAQVTQLESLGLDETNITDAHMADLTALPRLRILWLSGTGISDAAIAHLKRLRSLQIVHLSNTNITAAGLQELQRALPGCEVTMIGRDERVVIPGPK